MELSVILAMKNRRGIIKAILFIFHNKIMKMIKFPTATLYVRKGDCMWDFTLHMRAIFESVYRLTV